MSDTSLKHKWDRKAVIDNAVKEERARAEHRFVRNLIESTDFSEQRIAELASVTLDFVRKVKFELEAR